MSALGMSGMHQRLGLPISREHREVETSFSKSLRRRRFLKPRANQVMVMMRLGAGKRQLPERLQCACKLLVLGFCSGSRCRDRAHRWLGRRAVFQNWQHWQHGAPGRIVVHAILITVLPVLPLVGKLWRTICQQRFKAVLLCVRLVATVLSGRIGRSHCAASRAYSVSKSSRISWCSGLSCPVRDRLFIRPSKTFTSTQFWSILCMILRVSAAGSACMTQATVLATSTGTKTCNTGTFLFCVTLISL